MHHILKIKEAYYDAKLEGSKMFEIRHNDRGFQKGDTVSYKVEWSPGQWTDPQGLYEITYVTAFQQRENFVVFGEKEQSDDR